MKTYKQRCDQHPKALFRKDVFAAYYCDGGDEEWLYFKMLPSDVVRTLTRALQQMRVFEHYRLQREHEEYRNGYINERFCLLMIGRDEAHLPLPDVKRIVSEMVFAVGYELHWVPVSRIINLKQRR